ncbi:FumA C-terminus/TtdB family hydratase beta subunit [Entomobacter blattae]|uniref:FumA C-terminus/TtdB family hydratase beta subunit n=1 Tax=Entomobacter blattae TaxID=2762277 RepID=UPI0038CF9714
MITALTAKAFYNVSFLYHSQHLAQLAHILDDAEASDNDRFVALSLLKNAVIAAQGQLPMCQDTGTAIILGKKGERVWCEGSLEAALSAGVYATYTHHNLRYSQMAPLTMFEETNTRNNLPAQIDIIASEEKTHQAAPLQEDHAQEDHAQTDPNSLTSPNKDPNKEEAATTLELLFMAKGGGSANKTFLFQQTRGLLASRKTLLDWLNTTLKTLGTSACPPYHLAIVIGGLSAEMTLKTVKLASARQLDNLPTTGSAQGRAFRDRELEAEILTLTRQFGIGAQFGGKYFCHDVRVIRLPRHGASLPVGIGVSCSADRQIRAKITPKGVFLEALEKNPARFLENITHHHLGPAEAVPISLHQPMDQILSALSALPPGSRITLTGPMIVARDIAHARFDDRLKKGQPLPDYLLKHPIYYAGPAKTPAHRPAGSFGPTTAGRMDQYMEAFQKQGAALITLAKGNRSAIVRKSCKKYGGFYLGSIGGSAAELTQDSIRTMELLDFADLGMEAVWKIEVQNFPAFIIIDDKGHDFYENLI